jgi:hypothetical protein
MDPAQREAIAMESKRLGSEVHRLFNGGKYADALSVAEQQLRLLGGAFPPFRLHRSIS